MQLELIQTCTISVKNSHIHTHGRDGTMKMGFQAFRDSKSASVGDLLTFTTVLDDTGTRTIYLLRNPVAIVMVTIPHLTTIFDGRSTTMIRSIRENQ